jgi:hypothetical protein
VPLKILSYLREHAIATLALICSLLALAGSSYAAFSVPDHSVGAAKLDPRSIAASVSAWVNVQWGKGGKLVAAGSSSRVKVAGLSDADAITWVHRRFGPQCLASVTPQINHPPDVNLGGYVTAQFIPRQGLLYLFGFGPDGTRRPQAASVLVVCPTP